MTKTEQAIRACEAVVNGEPYDIEGVKAAVAICQWAWKYHGTLQPIAQIYNAFPGAAVKEEIPAPRRQSDPDAAIQRLSSTEWPREYER